MIAEGLLLQVKQYQEEQNEKKESFLCFSGCRTNIK